MQTGDKISFGQYTWLVLDIQEDAALLITDQMIGQRPYHNKAGDVSWADCELRTYLNNEVYQSFNEEEQAAIMKVMNKNMDNPWYGTDGGEATQDNIFLLSIEDAVCHYFGDSSALLYHPGKNQKYWFQRKDKNNIHRQALYDDYVWWWWLRSPGRAGNRAVYIWGDGNIGIQGNATFHYGSDTVHPLTNDNSGGIRPALWMKLTEISRYANTAEHKMIR